MRTKLEGLRMNKLGDYKVGKNNQVTSQVVVNPFSCWHFLLRPYIMKCIKKMVIISEINSEL